MSGPHDSLENPYTAHDDTLPVYYTAKYDYSPPPEEPAVTLAFQKGDIFEYLGTNPIGWYDMVLYRSREELKRGWVPSNYLESMDGEQAERRVNEMVSWFLCREGAVV